MRIFALAINFLALIYGCRAANYNFRGSSDASEIADTVPSLEPSKYMGRWYEVYSKPNAWYSGSMTCKTADYTWDPANSRISVRNAGMTSSYKLSVIEGEAVAVPNEPGKFTLKLYLPLGIPVTGSYWVYGLGPVVDGQYQWSIISNKDRNTLFVLARDPDTFEGLYGKQVKVIVESLGLSRMYVKSYQGAELDGSNRRKLCPRQTVQVLDPVPYMGHWEQLYGKSENPKNRNKLFCVTADYILSKTPTGEASVSVINKAQTRVKDETTGPLLDVLHITGDGVFPDRAHYPGWLDLTLYIWRYDPLGIKVPVHRTGKYWVLGLGPVEEGEGRYAWAVVSNPERSQLFVLARERKGFEDKYLHGVMEVVRKFNMLDLMSPVEC